MKAIIVGEYSGRFRKALQAEGIDAWSYDFEPAEDDGYQHIQGDARPALGLGWDLMVAHPECTRLTNAGSRWLHVPPPGKTLVQMWRGLFEGAEFYRLLRDAPIRHKAIENPVMHNHARELVEPKDRQVVQPWWFGDPFFKATGWELINLPALVPTNKLTPPKKGTPEHKAWSAVHRASPGPNRWKERSRTYPGMALAAAKQWSSALSREVKP